MSYDISPTAHATFSSALTQTVVSTTTAYPVIFETTEDIEGLYQASSVVTISNASPTVIGWSGHGLSIGAVVMFTVSGGGSLPTGITAGTPYYIISAGFGTDAFEISTSLGGAAVNTSSTGSGTFTAKCVSRFYLTQNGDYLMNISCIVDTTNNTAATMDIWFDKNGTNIANSNTIVAINNSNITQTVSVPFIADGLKGDYFRIFYRASDNNFRILATGTQTNPTRPACSSIIMTVNKTGR